MFPLATKFQMVLGNGSKYFHTCTEAGMLAT
jgi:hypothetical protein